MEVGFIIIIHDYVKTYVVAEKECEYNKPTWRLLMSI
jgi:hypothetical protein